MALSRPVCVDFWLDKKVYDNLSTNDKLIFIYLLTNSRTLQQGIYTIPIGLISYETNIPLEDVEESLKKLEEVEIINYSRDTDEVAILNYNKYSILKGGKPVEACYNNIAKSVKNKELIRAVYDKMLINAKNDTREIYSYALKKFEECVKENDETTLDD